ncbi:ABC transporter substrate-binding protein [Virgibacillus siamensis]|uniref:ABC transporter substrate-binding protein n=1 Tax=Virgibacillus siamensis TaxID=480071 RepID=UPI0009860284|nr:helical backbone metal receptor [Virgibacillus siamensis]
MRTITDHLGRKVTYSFPPKRIVSFAPAITETMYCLKLDEELVGRTGFCIHPKDRVEQAAKVGGTKQVKLDRVHDLHPDLIIVEKEENTKEMVEQLEEHYPVYCFEVQTVENAYRMIRDLGEITDREKVAGKLENDIQSAFQQLPNIDGTRVAYVIWKNPYMVAGGDTYINSLLQKIGFTNAFETFGGRYPSVTEEDLQQANLDYVFLATEPYPYKEKHLDEFQAMMPETIPDIIDGEMFWYGGRMLNAVSYFNKKLMGMK